MCSRCATRGEEPDPKLLPFHADGHPRQLPSFKQEERAFGIHAWTYIVRMLVGFWLASNHRCSAADDDLEGDDEEKDARKDGSDSGSDGDDEENRDGEVVEDHVWKDRRDNGVDTEVPHGDMVQPGEHEAEVGHSRDEDGDNGQDEEKDAAGDGEEDGSKQKKLESDGREEHMSKGDEFDNENHEGDEHEAKDGVVEDGHKKEGRDVDKEYDGDVDMVDAAQAGAEAD